LNAAKPSIIWVGLGSPKQDRWMHLYRPVLDAPLLIAVGAAFDFIGGTKQQAPIWMQRSGLEWLFRLLQEPRRLWQRYLIYNTRFVAQVISLYLQRAL
jgi:N-acetylglucosaminyldiphosphoundecaprenol N-acetyl-beta-D-mannosaminyltransferase